MHGILVTVVDTLIPCETLLDANRNSGNWWLA
jgi:hypothetical protein